MKRNYTHKLKLGNESVKQVSKFGIIFTGGGTGGHVFPGLAVYAKLQHALLRIDTDTYRDTIAWIGSAGGPEKHIVRHAHVPFFEISSGKFRRYFSLRNFIDPFRIIRGYFQAKKILARNNTQLVLSLGGYVSVPVVLAARRLKIPVFSLVCDVSLGLASKINALYSDYLLCVYPETISFIVSHTPICRALTRNHNKRKNSPPLQLDTSIDDRTIDVLRSANEEVEKSIKVLGPLLREEMCQGDATRANKKYMLSARAKVVVVLGGSKGSQQINDLVLSMLPHFKENFVVIHQTGLKIHGPEKKDDVLTPARVQYRCKYIPVDFFTDEYPHILARADLALARGGSGTLWELVANKIPSAIIPLSGKYSRGDQLENARLFAQKNYVLNLGPFPSEKEVWNSVQLLSTHTSTRKTLIQSCENFMPSPLPVHALGSTIATYMQCKNVLQ